MSVRVRPPAPVPQSSENIKIPLIYKIEFRGRSLRASGFDWVVRMEGGECPRTRRT